MTHFLNYIIDKLRVQKYHFKFAVVSRALIFPVLCFFVFQFTLITAGMAQYGPDTVYTSAYIQGTKTINTDIQLIGEVDESGNVSIIFTPTFKENGSVLKDQQITKYYLSYNIESNNIIAEPPGYFRLTSPKEKSLSITKGEIFRFESLVQKMTIPKGNFIFNFKLRQGYNTIDVIAEISLPLPITKEKTAVEESLNEPPVSGDAPGGLTVAQNPVQPSPVNTRQMQVQPEHQQTNDNSQQIQQTGGSTDELKSIVQNAKQTYNQVYSMKLNQDQIPVNSQALQQHNMEINRLKAQFDQKYMSGNFEDPESADRIYAVFTDYYNTTTRLIAELSNSNGGQQNQQTAANQMPPPEQKTDSDKLIIYLLVGLLVIILAVVVIMAIIKSQKKKNKVDFQKQMARRAQMELNKQKFQATSQKNKLRI